MGRSKIKASLSMAGSRLHHGDNSGFNIGPRRPRIPAIASVGRGELERSRDKSFKVQSQDAPSPEEDAQPQWAASKVKIASPTHSSSSSSVSLTSDNKNLDVRAIPLDIVPQAVYRVPGPRLGELINDPKKILNLAADKIIVDEHTDETIRMHMLEVLPTGTLTSRRVSMLVADGIRVCLMIWNESMFSDRPFWDRVGSSRGWLRHLGPTISRSFFLKLCVLYECGSRRTPNNNMMRMIAQLRSKFFVENKRDLDTYRVSTGSSTNRSHGLQPPSVPLSSRQGPTVPPTNSSRGVQGASGFHANLPIRLARPRPSG
ncbi:hypothetical protein M406DRAFT_327817 [Cryphonectria parasitica EP155]|uniref:Uncharacterized protein n=1 Tax=Cryphonectria parasitica (strain ATCC 38755 / EP155) TaxID=660469 RepID=A0A9P4Y550_CRYP1|nr:uncharacterized protein M406DRAFT_327817 [Cryphonectria parasitica EP155]KAF3766691.1 hypothetical protein M406DRAFT_327817 [Cryphonectria parasitica EP155]